MIYLHMFSKCPGISAFWQFYGVIYTKPNKLIGYFCMPVIKYNKFNNLYQNTIFKWNTSIHFRFIDATILEFRHFPHRIFIRYFCFVFFFYKWIQDTTIFASRNNRWTTTITKETFFFRFLEKKNQFLLAYLSIYRTS